MDKTFDMRRLKKRKNTVFKISFYLVTLHTFIQMLRSMENAMHDADYGRWLISALTGKQGHETYINGARGLQGLANELQLMMYDLVKKKFQ